MNIGVPRSLIVTVAALFSAYHLVLATYSLDIPTSRAPVLAAMVLYAVATVISLLPGTLKMPVWLAGFNVAVSIAIATLVSSALDPEREGGNGYATWYIAAVGTLMTITSTRRRHSFAWAGVLFLGVQTFLWAGPGAVLSMGVIGSISWVAVAHILSRAIGKAGRDAQRFALAEREATEWQAAQEAHLYERRFRLGQTSTMALPMLRTIRATGGELTEAQRLECRNLEQAIRDEIRGRRLLNDAVRREVMNARRRGATVNLLDEGGLDDLPEADRDRVLNRLAEAVAGTTADRIVARTVAQDSDVAITVVGLKSGDGRASALGPDDDEEEVDLWLQIPRAAEDASPLDAQA
jgi:hypothetical protein